MMRGSHGAKGSLLRSCLHGPLPAEIPQGQGELFAWHSRPYRSGPTYPPTVLPTSAPSSLTRHTSGPRHTPRLPASGPLLELHLLPGMPSPLHLWKFHPGSAPFPNATSSWSPSTAGLPFPPTQGTVMTCHEAGPVWASVSLHPSAQ